MSSHDTEQHMLPKEHKTMLYVLIGVGVLLFLFVGGWLLLKVNTALIETRQQLFPFLKRIAIGIAVVVLGFILFFTLMNSWSKKETWDKHQS